MSIINFTGILNRNFYLASNDYIPQQTLDQFNQVSTSLMENGFFQFVENFVTFRIQLRSRTVSNEIRSPFNFQTITIEGFYSALLMYILHVVVNMLILLCEIAWYQISSRLSHYFHRHIQNILRDFRILTFEMNH